VTEGTVVNDTEVLSRVNSLLQRLVPYATHAPGTPMYMKYARKNMLAMTTAPTITTNGCFRWFVTCAYADLYESRVYEIVAPCGADLYEYADREDIVCDYDKKTRARILRAHPALVARVFHEKQDAFWKYVMYGSDNPVGHIVDHMRRVEVSYFKFTNAIYVIYLHYTKQCRRIFVIRCFKLLQYLLCYTTIVSDAWNTTCTFTCCGTKRRNKSKRFDLTQRIG